jgi:hypothetical protein
MAYVIHMGNVCGFGIAIGVGVPSFICVQLAEHSTRYAKRLKPFERVRIVDQQQHSLDHTAFHSPEQVQNSWNVATDMWSVGVLLFTLQFGYTPFDAENAKAQAALIQAGFSPETRPGRGPWYAMVFDRQQSARDVCSLCVSMGLENSNGLKNKSIIELVGWVKVAGERHREERGRERERERKKRKREREKGGRKKE